MLRLKNKEIKNESAPVRLDLSAFENIFTSPLNFTVKDTPLAEAEILTDILSHYGILSGGNYYNFKDGKWDLATQKQIADKSNLSDSLAALSMTSAVEVGCYANSMLEGETLVNGSNLNTSFRKSIKRISEEITEISNTTHAFYDLEFAIYLKDNTKVFHCLNEVEVSISDKSYKVDVHNKNKKRINQDKLNRFASLDFMPVPPPPHPPKPHEPPHHPLPDDTRFDDLDIPQRKKKTPKDKDKDDFKMDFKGLKIDPDVAKRVKGLDMNARRRKCEAEQQLQFQQDQTLSTDTVLGQNLAKTAKQKLGKQNIATQQQVSPTVQKQADKMTPAKAYDFVEDVAAKWKETDAYEQYKDTLDLVDHWYKQNSVTIIDDSLMGSFKYIDDIHNASELARKIGQLEDTIANTKSKATLVSLKKELKDTQNEFTDIMKTIKKGKERLTIGKSVLDDSAAKLDACIEDYIEDYQVNVSQWKSVQDKMAKMSKQIETMEALKNKYVSNMDLPPLLYRYKDLMATPLPSIIDVESLKINDVDILQKAWYNNMLEYRKALESFNDSFQANYNALANVIGIKAKSRSLF